MEGQCLGSSSAEGLCFSAAEDPVLDSVASSVDLSEIPVSLEESPENAKNKRQKKQKHESKGSKRLSFAMRAEIIALVESKQHRLTRKQIAAKYGITTARICQILNDKERRRVAEELERGICPSRKRVCAPKYAALEQRLLQWIKRSVVFNSIPGYPTVRNPLSMPTICAQARLIAQELNITEFTGSNGWFTRFKERYGLSDLARVSRDMSQPQARATIAAAALRYSANQGIPLHSFAPQQTTTSLDPDEQFQEQSQPQSQPQQQDIGAATFSTQSPQHHQQQAQQQQQQLQQPGQPLYHAYSLHPYNIPPYTSVDAGLVPRHASSSKRKRRTDEEGDEEFHGEEEDTICDEHCNNDDNERTQLLPIPSKLDGPIAIDADAFLDRYSHLRAELSNSGDSSSLITAVMESLLKGGDSSPALVEGDV